MSTLHAFFSTLLTPLWRHKLSSLFMLTSFFCSCIVLQICFEVKALKAEKLSIPCLGILCFYAKLITITNSWQNFLTMKGREQWVFKKCTGKYSRVFDNRYHGSNTSGSGLIFPFWVMLEWMLLKSFGIFIGQKNTKNLSPWFCIKANEFNSHKRPLIKFFSRVTCVMALWVNSAECKIIGVLS